MSCRSTRASSSAFSYAQALSGLNETQIQSLFHELKREGKNLTQPTREEYVKQLNILKQQVEEDPSLKESAKTRIVERINKAASDEVIDAASWHATLNIKNRSITAAQKLQRILNQTASNMGIDEQDMETIFHTWLKNSDDYENIASPDEKFRYDLDPNVPHDEKTLKALRKLGYEQYLAQPYPVFVYGTLRPGQGNYRLMGDAVQTYTSGVAKGIGIYGPTRGFPYAAEHKDDNAITVGEVVWLSNDYTGVKARQNLDYLEGFSSDYPTNSHYERVLKTINIQDNNGNSKEVKAWMYLARGYSRSALQENDRILHGDWVQAKNTYKPSNRENFYQQLWGE